MRTPRCGAARLLSGQAVFYACVLQRARLVQQIRDVTMGAAAVASGVDCALQRHLVPGNALSPPPKVANSELRPIFHFTRLHEGGDQIVAEMNDPNGLLWLPVGGGASSNSSMAYEAHLFFQSSHPPAYRTNEGRGSRIWGHAISTDGMVAWHCPRDIEWETRPGALP